MNSQKRVNEGLAKDLDNLQFENKKLLKINEDYRQQLRVYIHIYIKQSYRCVTEGSD